MEIDRERGKLKRKIESKVESERKKDFPYYFNIVLIYVI